MHARFGTPVAIVVSSTVYAIFAAFSFRELIVLNVWLYSLALVVELAAFLWLRTAAARAGRMGGHVGGGGAAVCIRAAGHGDRGLAQHARGRRRRDDGPGRLRARKEGAGDS